MGGSLVRGRQCWKVDWWVPNTDQHVKEKEFHFRSEESKVLTKVANTTIDQKVITAVIIAFRTCFSTFSF